MKMTVEEIRRACGGKLLCGDPEAVVTSVSTDSRKIEPGALFVPIKGERTDAHAYITATFAAGAVATLTEEHTEMEDSHAWIRVPNTLSALQLIATAYRQRFSIPVVGVTGSVGKTTTKEMIALALSAEKKVMRTEGNHNSQVGLPLTMFRLEPEHEVAVVEMGMSDFGEMSRLAEIAAPNCAVITNIGISHIQQLKTQQNILGEKLHIIDRFQEDSVLFLNGDDPMLAGLRGKLRVKTRYFGMQPWCDDRAEQIAFHPNGVRFVFRTNGIAQEVDLPVLGLHNVTHWPALRWHISLEWIWKKRLKPCRSISPLLCGSSCTAIRGSRSSTTHTMQARMHSKAAWICWKTCGNRMGVALRPWRICWSSVPWSTARTLRWALTQPEPAWMHW